MLKKLTALTLAGAFAAATLLSAAPASAFDHPAGAALGAGAGPLLQLAALVRSLDLTDAQKQEIKSILKAHQDNLLAIALAERVARQHLLDTIHQPTVNEPAVRQASAVVAREDADLAVERAKIFSEVSAVLTADQRATLKDGLAEIQQSIQQKIEAMLALLKGLL